MLGKQKLYVCLLAAILTFDDSWKLALWVFGTFDCVSWRNQIYVKNFFDNEVSLTVCNLFSLKELRSTALK